ncbi:MAG: dihydroneopterin aldolase [Cyclobacteriaceae bacterium]
MKNSASVIHLKGLEFYAYHGFFEEEQKLGNRFTIDLEINVDFAEAGKTDELAQTVDYGQVYEVVSSVMKSPAKLLETIATDINGDLLKAFPAIKTARVMVSKHNPPIGGLCEMAIVSLTSER